MSPKRRHFLLAVLAISITCLYFYKLDGVGVLGPDEPRYEAVGRAMAESGDYVTPRLWGSPWFEKPPLLYWMTALGTSLGLNPDLCGRLPVACLSLVFLASCFVLLRREFNGRVAGISTALLGTSAGWLSFSGLCLTDIPLAVFFSLAVVLTLPLLRADPNSPGPYTRLSLIGVCLGLAMLAKGLVPVALALPFAWYLRSYWKQWWALILAALVVSLPWYLAVYQRNGYPFIQDFFIKHHFERVYSASLLHVRPVYYYIPVFLGALFPWTPLFGLLARRDQVWDKRRGFLLSIVLFGLVFFSIPVNKLPGYLLPLLPSFFILLGSLFEFRPVEQISRAWLLSCAVLVAAVPFLASLLPESLALGRISVATIGQIGRVQVVYIAMPILVALLARRSSVAGLLVLCIIPEALFLKATTYPIIDATVSARSLWRATASMADEICDGGTNRDWIFGLSYYRGRSYPRCGKGNFKFELRTVRRGTPDLVPIR